MTDNSTETSTVALSTALTPSSPITADELDELKEMVAGLPAEVDEAAEATHTAWRRWEAISELIVALLAEHGIACLWEERYDLADYLPKDCAIADQLREFCQYLDQIGEDLGTAYGPLGDTGHCAAEEMVEILDRIVPVPDPDDDPGEEEIGFGATVEFEAAAPTTPADPALPSADPAVRLQQLRARFTPRPQQET